MFTKSRCKDSKTRNGEVVNGAIEAELGLLTQAVLRGEKDALFWPAFELGTVVVTKGIVAKTTADEALHGLYRHGRCDWGDLCEEERTVNNTALRRGGRLLSRYHTRSGTAFYVITESDRSVTTVLLPEEN